MLFETDQTNREFGNKALEVGIAFRTFFFN